MLFPVLSSASLIHFQDEARRSTLLLLSWVDRKQGPEHEGPLAFCPPLGELPHTQVEGVSVVPSHEV